MAKKKLRPSKLFVQILKALSIVPLSACLPAQAALFDWASPLNSFWNVAGNWSPAAVPNGAAADVTIGSAGTVVTVQIAPAEVFTVNSITFTSPTTDYNLSSGGNLTVSGSGVFGPPSNNGNIPNSGTLNFTNSATAGSNGNVNYSGNGIINFQNTSTSGAADFLATSGGIINFQNNSTGGTAGIITLNGATVNFKDSSSAANASFGNSGTMNFQNTSSAGNVSIINNSTGIVNFQGTNNNAGQSATIANSPNGRINILGTTAGVSVGSINETAAGTGGINLGAQTLTIGALNLANSLYNVIQGAGGGLTKVGSNTLNLLADNTYTGVTTISAGTLQLGNGVLTTGSVVGNIVDNAALIFNRPNTLLYGGNISETGTGTVTQAGAGTTILTGTNTYTGGTTISAGTLQIGNGGVTGTIAGNIVDNAALIFNRSDASTYAGNVSGTGSIDNQGAGVGSQTTLSGILSGGLSLTQSGTGTTILTGTNTYTGGTTIFAGTLQLGNGGATGSVTGNILDNAALAVNRSDTYTYGNVISGAGSLTQLGGGTLVLTGGNTYAGGTTISAGTLQLGNGGGTGSVVGNILDNAALIFNRNVATSYGGVISGTGSVRQSGAQTLTFTGDNTYAGMTTIDPGTFLQLGNNTTTGSIVGDANLGALGGLIFNRSNSLTYAGSMNGAGSVQQIGSGTTILTVASGYTGGTTISAGTLQLGNGGLTGSVVGDILDNATLVFNHNVAIGYAGVISGTGSVRQSGAQTLTFTGDNTYTGITTIDPGTFLQLGNNGATGSIVGDAVLGGGLIFNRSNSLTYAGNMSGAGDVKQVGSGATTLTGTNTYTGGTSIIAGAGPLQLGNGGTTGSVVGNIVDNAALIVNRSNSYTYGDIISGTGTLTKLGAGTLVLNGTNTFTGDTTINSGNLLLGDVAHPGAAVGGNVIVNTGGQLSGFGTVGGNLTNGGGIVSPGNSIGTITVNGNYTQSVAGSYIVQVDQAGNSDLLNILGTASLNGTVGISAINNGFLPNYAYTILTAAGGVSGTFSNTNIDGIFNQGFLQGVVSYFPNMVQFKVSFNPALFTQSAVTPNEKAVADYLLLTGGTPAVQALIASITTADQFRSAMDQISGATYANNDVMITRVGNWFSGEMADRFDAFPSCNCNVSLLPANRRGCDQKNEFWVAGHGAEENIKGGDVSGLNTDTGNFALGYEWAAGSTGKVGVGAGYSTFSSRAQTREMANTTGNLYQVGLYGRNQMGNWLLGAAFDAGVTSDLDTDRRIEGALAVVTTKGSSKAHLYSEQVRLGYDLTPNRPMRFSPFVGVIGQQLNRNSFAENTKTGFELNVDGSTYRSTRSQLGVMLELPTNSAFKPFASVDWEHEFSDVNSTFNANLVGLGGKFHIEGQAIGRNSVLVKAGTVIACGRNWNVSALYQGWYGNSWQENGGTLQASVAFG